jgi:hypothetical protein
MAILEKRADREAWLRWAIALMWRGLWLDVKLEIHAPHDRSKRVWRGSAWATVASTGENVPCVFFAKARRSKYDLVDIRVYMGELGTPLEETDRCPVAKVSQLSPRARRWLRAAQSTARKLRREHRREKWRRQRWILGWS